LIGLTTHVPPAAGEAAQAADRALCDFCHLPIPRAHRLQNEPSRTRLYCCYGCRLASDITGRRGESGQVNWMLTRLGVAVFLSMAVMMFSMFGYRQQIAGGAPTEIAVQLDAVLRYASLLFATPVLFLLGIPIAINAIEQARRGIVSIDGLVMLGVAAAFAQSYVATLAGQGQTYFETGCAILVFVTLGRWLEARGRLRASDAIDSLDSLFPAEVEVERDGKRQAIRAADVRMGDLVLVAAGGRIPADGWIESGRAHIDEQIVTGESTPVVRDSGDEVRAGTIDLDGGLRIRATATGSTSTLGRLIRLIEDARRSKSRYERLSERLAAVMVPLTVTLAIAAVYLGTRRGAAMDGVMAGLSVLLIACPCALGIATPMAICVALGQAASRHILFRDAETLEKLASLRFVCLDKTGTLTTGEPRVGEFRLMPSAEIPTAEALSLAAGLAETSSHSLSRAVVSFARSRGITSRPADESAVVAGRGLIGSVAGHRVALGNMAIMSESGKTAGSADARTAAFLWIDDSLRGEFRFEEFLRPNSRMALDELRAARFEIAVLTGDHRARGESLAGELGVPVHSELLPEHKLRIINEYRNQRGPIAMVGDGLNDAPALAAADVGIALGCGADLTREAAGVCLLGNDLAAVPWVIRLSQRTVRTIKENLFWAFAYNIVGVGLALNGKLSPVFAAGAMVVSSLLVVGNSLRLAHDRGAES